MCLSGVFNFVVDKIAPIFVGRDGMGRCHGISLVKADSPNPTKK